MTARHIAFPFTLDFYQELGEPHWNGLGSGQSRGEARSRAESLARRSEALPGPVGYIQIGQHLRKWEPASGGCPAPAGLQYGG